MRAEIMARRASTHAVVLAVVLIASFALATAAACAITRVDVANNTDRVLITVTGNSALKMTPLIAPRGNYVGFQFPCSLAAKARLVGIRSGGIYNVRISVFRSRPPVSRIVVNTSGRRAYSTRWSDDRTRLEISVFKAGQAAAVPVVRVKPAVAEVTNPETGDATLTAVPAPQEVKVTLPAPAPAKAEVRQPVRIASSNPAVGMSAAAQTTRWSPDRNISLNFLGADINDVLKALAVQSGHNIVASKDVKGNVTVSLSKVSIDEAMDYVAKLSGYGYVNENGTYLVAPRNDLNSLKSTTGGRNTEVVALNYTNPDDVVALLKTQCPDVEVTKASVQSQKAAKSADSSAKAKLVMSGEPERLALATTLVAKVEESMKVQSAEEKTEIYKVKYVNASELKRTLIHMVPGIMVAYAPTEGFDLVAPSDIKVGDAGSSVAAAEKDSPSSALGSAMSLPAESDPSKPLMEPEPENKVQALLVSGNAADVDKALELAQTLDVKSPQIKIDAKVTAITDSGEKKLGLQWEWDQIAFIETSTNAWKRGPVDFAATLDALVTNGDAQLLASPSIVCLENKPGVFFVGDDVTYIVRVETTPTGQNVTTETKSAGVQLRVVGDVSPDGYITLNLHPEVSVLQLEENRAANIFLPRIKRRFTDHVVRVKNGQTIVIGGLIRNDELESMSKVPLLGDIPFFGNLFRHKSKVTEHTEVVMFITASIMAD